MPTFEEGMTLMALVANVKGTALVPTFGMTISPICASY
jgi:hypothetical protein